MGFLFVTCLFAILALINAYEILLPKAGDKWAPGPHQVTWKDDNGSDKVNVFLYRGDENPPLYILLAAGVSAQDKKADVTIPYNIIPGSGYTILLTLENPYYVLATSGVFDIVQPSNGLRDTCINYLNEDGSATSGPIPGDSRTVSTSLTPPTPTGSPSPTELPSPTGLPSPTPPDGDFDCDDCDECEECGECEPDEGCDCGVDDEDEDEDEDKHEEDEHEEDEHEEEEHEEEEHEEGEHDDEHNENEGDEDEHDHDNENNKMANIGFTNIVARFWLIMMVTVSSIIFM